MDTHSLTVEVEGLADDQHHVRLDVFIHELEKLKASLDTVLRDQGIESPDHYNVLALSHNSPACVTIAPFYRGNTVPPIFSNARDFLLSTVNTITQYRTAPDTFTTDALKKVREIASPFLKNKLAKLVIRSATTTVEFNAYTGAKFVEHVDNIIRLRENDDRADIMEIGEILGMLESFNAHDGKNECTIYPIIGKSSVKAHFSTAQIKAIIPCLCRYVRVFGTIYYKAGDFHPYKIEIDTIAAMPEESDLPDFDDLFGIAPNLTGGLTSDEFIRKVRDEWD
jgi:hypothetical protein